MSEGGKADWEIRLEKYFEKPVAETKVDKMLSSSQLQSILIDIEKTAGEAKRFLAANMISEVKVQLDKLRALLKVLEKGPQASDDLVVSLLKAGVSERVLKEIYGVTDEEIEKAKRLLEAMGKGSPREEIGAHIKWIIVHDKTVVLETTNYDEALTKFYALQKEKGWYPPALAMFKQEQPSSSSPYIGNPRKIASLEDAFRAVVKVLKEKHPTFDYKSLLDNVDAWLSDKLDNAVRADDFPETQRLAELIEALRVVEREESVFSSSRSHTSPEKAEEEPITMQRIRCSNLYEALRALEPVLARAREKKESDLESAVSKARELIAKKLEECPSEWYMESPTKHGSSSSNPDDEELEYERLREKARLAKAETLI